VNAATEIDRLLAESGAVLVRHKKHLVYRLPNGRNFVAAKTPSDPARAAKNNLSDLRRALQAQATASDAKETPTVEPDLQNQPVPATAAAQPPPPAILPRAPPVLTPSELRSRIVALIARE
jgi:hypothetical protein